MGYIKNERKMHEALAELAGSGKAGSPDGPRIDFRNWNYDWVDALDVDDMLDICEVTIRSSWAAERPWAFLPEDFPYIDNKNWLKHGGSRSGRDIRIEHVPVE
jgi:succinate dehydrogenase / fumarate reductase flavoprotein subunit